MHKIFEIITEIIGWIQIVLSPTLLGIGFGFGIYYYFQTKMEWYSELLLQFLGLLLGWFGQQKNLRQQEQFIFYQE